MSMDRANNITDAAVNKLRNNEQRQVNSISIKKRIITIKCNRSVM